MGSIGPLEIVVILVVALVVLGPNRLPEAARSVGKAFAELKRMTTGFQDEVKDAFTEPAPSYPKRAPQSIEPAAPPARPQDADITATVDTPLVVVDPPLVVVDPPLVEVEPPVVEPRPTD
ncbi:MAG: Sec-independent protein translocase protein TatB [Acidimicrobiales bacterium]